MSLDSHDDDCDTETTTQHFGRSHLLEDIFSRVAVTLEVPDVVYPDDSLFVHHVQGGKLSKTAGALKDVP